MVNVQTGGHVATAMQITGSLVIDNIGGYSEGGGGGEFGGASINMWPMALNVRLRVL